MVRQTVEIFARVRPVKAEGRSASGAAPLRFVSDVGVPYTANKITGLPEEGGVGKPLLTAIELENLRSIRRPEDASANSSLNFRFNRVFDPSASQDDVYKPVVAPLIGTFLSGINCTVMAYGQTGSGKTWTMCGGGKYKNRGVIQRAIGDIFAELEKEKKALLPGKLGAGEEEPFPGVKLTVSYMEIYNENVYDLLDERNGDKPIELWERVTVREGRDGELHLKNLRQYQVKTERDVLNLLFLGNMNRMTAETPMNHASSRSHCIFTLSLERTSTSSDLIVASKFNLVDLAGSERIFKTGIAASVHTPSSFGTPATSDLMLRKEGKYINLSLHHLEQVIIALQTQANKKALGDEMAPTPSAAGITPRTDVKAGIAVMARGRSLSRIVPNAQTPAGYRSRTPSASAAGRDRSASNASRGAHQRGVSAFSFPDDAETQSGKASRRSSMTSATSGNASSVSKPAQTSYVHTHVPYRNSMLTSILRDSLGGNCKTVLIATLNPEPEYIDESVSTCRFAVRCGQLCNDVHINESRDAHVTVQILQKENAKLLSELESEKTQRERESKRIQALEALLSRNGVELPQDVTDGSNSTSTASYRLDLSLLRPLVKVERQQIEARIADAIKLCHTDSITATASSSTSSPHAADAVLEVGADGMPVKGVPDAPPALHSLAMLATHLRLKNLSESYAAVDMLMDAVKRAVSAAATATAELDHERARLHASLSALTSVRQQITRYERDLQDWESRHAVLLGDHTTVKSQLSAVTAELASTKAALTALEATHRETHAATHNHDHHHHHHDNHAHAGVRSTGGAALDSRPGSPLSSSQLDVRNESSTVSAANTGKPNVRTAVEDTSSVISTEDVSTDVSLAPAASLQHHVSMASISSDNTFLTRKTTDFLSPARSQVMSVRDLLITGGLFIKHGRKGSPHLRFVWVDGDFLGIHWRAVGRDRTHIGRGSMPVASVIDVVAGRKTAVFSRNSGGRTGREDACFSLVAADRTLDLEVQWQGDGKDDKDGKTESVAASAVTREEKTLRDKWIAAIRLLLVSVRKLSASSDVRKVDEDAEDELSAAGVKPGRSKDVLSAMESLLLERRPSTSSMRHSSGRWDDLDVT